MINNKPHNPTLSPFHILYDSNTIFQYSSLPRFMLAQIVSRGGGRGGKGVALKTVSPLLLEFKVSSELSVVLL